MQDNKNKPKKRRPFWKSWRFDASEHFNVSVSCISKWYKYNNYELMVWLEEQIQERNSKTKKAIEIKKELEKKYMGTPES